MPTPQQNAVTSAINLAALANQAEQLNNAIVAWLTDYNQNIWDTYWAQMATVTVEADGSLAGSNDTTPNNAHPINVPAATPLLIARNNLITLKTAIGTLATVFTQAGGAVPMPTQTIVQTCRACRAEHAGVVLSS